MEFYVLGSQIKVLEYEVNFLTAENMGRSEIIRTIKAEFDLVQMCQIMSKIFGFDARQSLDRFIALSLRKLLCDSQSLFSIVCSDFRMPPLSGSLFDCPGENNDMKLFEIKPSIFIKPQDEWIPVEEWLEAKIGWIDKGINDIPDALTDRFFKMIAERVGDREFTDCFTKESLQGEEKKTIWRLKNPSENRSVVYSILKSKGYYDLTIRRMIKYYADRIGAHLDTIKTHWISSANAGVEWNHSALSVFATHMIYAATKQIPELKDYLDYNPSLETL